MVLIIGGSGSGKSAYAEEYITMLSQEKRKYYLATMQVFDKEGQEKINRHRRLRRGRGFVTIEQPFDIHKALEKMNQDTQTLSEERTALLECMSNLAANEMFSAEIPESGDQVADKIIRETELLRQELLHLVIVTNNVFEDGVIRDVTTMEYMRALGSVNERLAEMADRVIEVVVGIPVVIKEGK